MTSVDDLFKKANGSSGSKRKFDITSDPRELYKSAKVKTTDVRNGGTHATVEEEAEDEEEYGVSAPPDEEEAGDDEDGRFFGSGVNKESKEAMDYLNERGEENHEPQKIDKAWVRRVGLNFEKRISKNAELRSKYEDDPDKFMGSEADLDADVKGLSILSEHPDLYEEFARIGCVRSLVSLLAHENTDIAIDSIQIISELTDEDVQAEQTQWDTIVTAMLDADLLSLLISNFSRFDENNDVDRSGVFHSLGVMENIASSPDLVTRIGSDASVLQLLLNRLTERKSSIITQNIQYTAEILSILLQSSPSNRTAFLNLEYDTNAIDTLLQLLAPYRRRDPRKDSEEEEYVENVFAILTCLLDETAAKSPFVEAEGIELILIMLRDSKFAKSRAIRLLDHALGGSTAAALPVCEKLVDAAGLKTVFGMLMKKPEPAATEHLLAIIASLLRALPGDSGPRIRLLAKFTEKDWEKIRKLTKLRREYAGRLEGVDKRIEAERKGMKREQTEEMADEWLSRRLDAGLYGLQNVDVVLAWLVAEDEGAKKRIGELLAERDGSLQDIKDTLKGILEGIDTEDDEASNTKEMLSTLMTFL
ncbi:MAG: hypothetical protein M1820_009717 [Bogoriella megaspora]|nr:MAG: hypothetical protein M1820_009717 [Bogoriella megaspora]